MPLLRVLLNAHLTFTAMLWVLFTIVVMGITGIVAAAGEVSDSILHQAATQAPRWLMFGLGIDVVSTYLRIQLAHGRTRREFAGQALGYTAVLSGFTAVLITVSYLLERGFYALFGWPQRLAREGVFSSADQYPAILGTYWLSFLLWTVAGLVIGLGFFRSTAVGLLTIPLGLAIVLPSITVTRNSGLPIFGDQFSQLELGTGLVLTLCAGLFAVGAVLVWAMARNVPMKTKAA